MNLTLGADSDARKKIPVFSGCLAYFAAALAGVAKHSFVSNEKHNPGEPLHWSRGKSSDHEDCQARHLMDIADMRAAIKRDDPTIPRLHPLVPALLTEANANSWRALALSQELHEEFAGAPLSPGSKAAGGPEKPADAPLSPGSKAAGGPEKPADMRAVGGLPGRKIKTGDRISFKENGTRVTGAVVHVTAAGDPAGFVVQRDDGRGWINREYGEGKYWHVFTAHDLVELV